MEGERLLQCIKCGTDGRSLLRDLEVYLAPLLQHKASPSKEVASKYGLYSMKVLRACVQQLTALKKGHAAVPIIISVANRSCKCIYRAMEHMVTVPLSLEKLLFHMVVQSMAKGLVADAMVFARNLYERLLLCQQDFMTGGDGTDNEYDTVCKQAFNQLWKVCVDLEHSSKHGGSKHMVVLDVRLQALSFLMLTTYELSWVFERAIRAIAEFDRASSNSVDEHNQVFEFLRTVLDGLHSDLGGSKKKDDLPVSELLLPLFDLSLHFAKRCKHLQKPDEALGVYERLQKLINTKCDRHCEKLYSAAVNMTMATLQLSKSSSDVSSNSKNTKTNAKADTREKLKESIQDTVNRTSKAIKKKDPDFHAVQCLVDSLEFFRKLFDCIGSQQDVSPNYSFASGLSDGLASSVDAALNLLLDLLQLQREHLQGVHSETSTSRGKQNRLSLQKAINRQLATLNLMSSILLHRMNKQDEEAVCQGQDTRQLSQDALCVCQRTLSIIEEVSGGAGGAVSTNEHRCLGTNAYNLGLVCYRKKFYLEAVPLLTLACKQLEVWCITEELVDGDKLTKIQLICKYELLVDCQRKAGQHREAMQTVATYVWSHLGHLTDQLMTPVELWVKAKRDAVKSQPDDQLRTRTLFDAIQEIEGNLSDEMASLVSRLLEQELGIYKTQRYETTVEQYAVVCDLLSLYCEDKMRLHRAHAHIEQAQLLREGTLETDCCPVDCCREAIHLLEDLGRDFMQQQLQDQETKSKDYMVVFDLLATAFFWLYICQSEANQATYITSQFVAPKEEPASSEPLEATTGKKDKSPCTVQSGKAYTLPAEHSATEPLDRALDIWSDLMAGGSCKPSMFNDPGSTCYCLKVAASLCELADRPLQQVQALSLLILLATATSSSEDAVLAHCQIIQALCRLGAIGEAETLLGRAQTLQGVAGVDADDRMGVEAALMITECYVLLAAHKIREFEFLLGKLQGMHSHKRRSRQNYLRKASLKHLQSLYLLLPATDRSPDGDASSGAAHLVLAPDDPSSSPLELRAEAMRLQMGVGRLVFGDGVFGNDQTLQNDGFKLAAVGSDSGWNDIEFNQWTVMASVLQSLYDVGSLYMEQGCVREAKSYLKEGLLLAEKFMLPRRCVAFLLQLSSLQTQCGQEEDCLASLSKIQQVLHLSQRASSVSQGEAQALGQATKQSMDCLEDEAEDDEDNFIRTKRMSISIECPSEREISTDNTSSPSLRTAAARVPSYHSHPFNCVCVSCSDVSLHAQELALCLQTALCLELQGEPSKALVHLQAGLNTGDWCAKQMPSLLHKSCVSLLNGISSTKANKKEGKTDQNANTKAISQGEHGMHVSILIKIHVCMARLNLLRGALAEAGETIKKGLVLSPYGSVHKSWLKFYEILGALELKGRVEETTVRGLISSTWDVQSNSEQHQIVQTPEDDLASQFDQLDLGKPSSKSQTRFQDSVFSDRMQRPEVSRKLSVRVADHGIFCDISENEDSDDAQSAASSLSKSSKQSHGVIKETPQHVATSSNKGALMFSVRKKKPARRPIPDEVTPVISSITTSAFDFDEPSPVKPKKAQARGKSVKTAKTRKQIAQVVVLDTNVDEVFEDDKKDSKNKVRSKRATTAKKSERINETSAKTEPQNVDSQEEVSIPKPSRRTKKAAETVEESTVKPRRGRKAPAVNTELLEPQPTSARPRRGRKPNIENLRSEAVVTQAGDDYEDDLTDLLSISLEVESPSKGVLLSSPRSPVFSKDCRLEDSSSPFAPGSSVNPDAHCSVSNSTALILADLDEIEIPRAGGQSDSEESKSSLKILRKTARKPTTARRKPVKKVPVEDAEVLRGTKSAPLDTRTGRKKTQQPVAAIHDNIMKSASSISGTSVDSMIPTLEKIASEVRHRAPAALYRHACQLLAACCGDRDPVKAAYYLSEATAITLRHQKLASLTKKIKKLRKEREADCVDTLSSAAAAMTLDGNDQMKDGRSWPGQSDLRHLTEERALFTFNRSSRDQESSDVVQQTINALPEGWTVCMLSVVSSGAALQGGSLSDGDSLLICRLGSGRQPVLINHNMRPDSQGPSAASLLEEFDGILVESKLSVKETEKRAWWTCRQQLDQRMQVLTEGMEETFLGPWKGLLLGARTDREEVKSLASAAEKLKSMAEAACRKPVDLQLCQCILDSSRHLSKTQLSSGLASLTGLSPTSDQHSYLVSSVKQLVKDWAPAKSRKPVILILDKQIQQLPWENTRILRDSPVCRMPSLYFILSHLKARTSSSSSSTELAKGTLDPSDAYFVLNPSNDLANTQKTFQKWFERENGWKGVVARPPSKEEYKSALTDHQLFVFCGHGNGREFLTGDDIQRLSCRATSLLIGCSSGRLHVTGAQEASGMVLNYLVAECPCLVANLWDVTDRDIDRFLEQLLRSWLAREGNEGGSLLDCMAQARQACKLQYLIGCSPVVYGLPVGLKDKADSVCKT